MALSEKMKDRIEMVAAALLIGAAVAGSGAIAQRDPAYQQARADGLIGEKTDGYLGFVTPPSPAVKALVDDLNIKRKAKYTEEALANGATVEEMAFRTGCRLIKERTAPGEMYQAPDKSWKTRDASPPVVDVRCP
ncbi:YdbL family protein [uncultured Sphingorhabdus sp.]|uniref:YdbL family protein n=1 Tax=uncultured Sphingorhabdus sp. TaxID=1686106 RepID=UPI0026033F00|nr:YdbL family protein [uncultured Sphingorhabdus sp.]HMS19319.1 YdbL family protein [Sphingorhabdus sp.]